MAFVPTLDLHEHTLPGLLRRNAERLPDNDCIVAPEFGICWSWKRLMTARFMTSPRTERFSMIISLS